jgi:hypothetical protein
MSDVIYQGDNGTILQLTIRNGSQIVNITDATVQVLIRFKDMGILKAATIVDGINGKCQITLNSQDIIYEGIYQLQATVVFPDGDRFSSNVQRFSVNKKMGYIPSTGGGTGGGTTEVVAGTNGHILVNGIDVKVYDDSALQTALSEKASTTHIHPISEITNLSTTLSNKSDTGHKHTTLDITDFDVTNKTNGYVMTYDSTLQKFVPKALPVGSGGGARNLAYVIELERWNITEGIPAKPWVDANYHMANANIMGINNALQYAYDNGFSEVVFPRGEYAICYPNPIRTQPDMVINFNRSTLKVIYSSTVRSPLDTSPVETKAYHLGGVSILCDTPNTHIINLNLIGERVERSWIDVVNGISEEQRLETTVGIKLGGGSDKSSVRYCDISHYMSDAIYVSFDPYSGAGSIGQMEFGDIDASGTLITGTEPKMVRTINFIPVDADVKSFTMIGLGYAPATSIPNGMYNVAFYNADGTFVFKQSNIRTRDRVIVPAGATKFKLTWVGDGTVDQGLLPNNPAYMAILIRHGISDNTLIEYNTIHRCHRGGLFLGANNVTIRKNHFHNVGYQGDKDIDGLGTFTDFTRYSITTEDHVGHNCKIMDNVFENTRMAVALRGEYNEVTGNEFKNCTYSVMMYLQRHIVVSKNVMYYSEMHCYEYNDQHRNWIIADNIFNYSSLTLPGTGTVSTITGNNFANGSDVIINLHALNFTGNSFNNSTITPQMNDTIIDKCTFTNGSHIDVFSHAKPYTITGCTFVNSYILGQSSNKLIVRDSILKESSLRFSSAAMIFRLENCKVDNVNESVISHPTYSGLGRMSHTLELEKCTISLGSKAIINANDWKKLKIVGCTINYNVSSNLTTGFVTANHVTDTLEILDSTITASTAQVSQNASVTKDVIISRTNLTNFSLTSQTVQTQSDLMTTMPIGGYYKLAQQILNAAPTSGGSIGWICTVEGWANDAPWTQTTAYTVGKRVYVGENVYQCTVAGTSSTTAPSHTSGEVLDGTSLKWSYIGKKAVFKEFGLISE